MKVRMAAFSAAVLMLWLAADGGAYSVLGRRWASGSNVVMQLQLGASSGTLIDGSASWNASAENALAIWSPFLSTVSVRVVRDSTAGVSSGNGLNNVTWGDDVYGEPFGANVLAVTVGWYRVSDNTYTEADVVFNRAKSWSSYRGNLRQASGGGTLHDLRRVAIHEFGHVLGLDHPDEHGQSVSAIMNSIVSNVDTVQSDDTNGVRAIYGGSSPAPTPAPPSNRPPSVTATCNPCTVPAGQTTTLNASGSDPDGDSLSYQWSASQGSFNNANAASAVWTAPVQTGAVTATVTVQDGRGGRATASVTLQVIPRDTLRSGGRLLPGQALTSANNRYRLVYQTDGNLVLYDDLERSAYWSSGTAATSAGQVVMQADGNLVIYDAQVAGRWSSGTAGNSTAFLVLQPDGNLVVYRADNQPLWWWSQAADAP